MSLDKFTKEELEQELNRRLEDGQEDKKESHLIIATGGIDGRQYYVEVFREIKTVADMPNMDSVMLRARFNSHRHMKLFYFKSDDFETLNAELEEDHDGFAEWLHTNPNIKWEIL